MKFKSIILFSSIFIGLTSLSCSNNNGGTPIGEFNLSSLTALDIDNNGNGSDISLSYSITSDLSVLKELRLLLSKEILNLEEANQTASINYTVLPLSLNEDLVLDATLKDTGGEAISEATYQVYVLGVFEDETIPSILSTASTLTLKNETVVTTMELTGTYNAMEDVALADDGTLYVNGGNISPGNLYKITKEGVSSVLSNQMNSAVGIAIDNQGNIYSSNFNSTSIQKTTPAGVTTNFVTDTRLTGGGGLAFDNDGNLFNTFFSSPKLFKIVDGVVTEFTSNTLFSGPIGVTFDKSRGELFVASFNSGKIFNVSETGDLTEIADTPASIGHMAYANEHFYVTGWNQHRVFKVSRSGQIIESIGLGTNGQLDGPSSLAQFSQPNGIAVSEDGKYAYVSQGNGILRKIIMARDN